MTLHPCLTCRTDTAYASLPLLAHEPWWFQCLCSACLDRTRPRFIPNLTPEEVKARGKACQARWYTENREKANARARQWQADNPERARALGAANAANATARQLLRAGSLSADQIEKMLKTQNGCCSLCQTDITQGYEVDHWVPFSRGGKNFFNNVHLLCQACNQKKRAHEPYTWCALNGLPIPKKFSML